MDIQSPKILGTPERVAALDRLGDEIAELSAHLDAATARLLASSVSSMRVRAGPTDSAPVPPG